MTKYPIDFIKEMPKSDLHLHMDGSLRIPTLIEMAKKDQIKMPAFTEEGLRELVFKDTYQNLGEYLHGFQYTCAALRNLENKRLISLLIQALFLLAEMLLIISFAPQRK